MQELLAPPPPKNTPFSPSRIRQKILSTQLDGREPLPTIRDASPEEAAAPPQGNDDAADKEVDGDVDGGDSSSATLPPDSPKSHLWSRDEPYNAASSLPNPESITVDTLEKHMYTARDPPLELFVRTSGVERLSDFMLWQCHQDTHLFFLECYWPDFDLQHFIWVMLEWQWRQKQRERDGQAGRARSGSKGRLMVE